MGYMSPSFLPIAGSPAPSVARRVAATDAVAEQCCGPMGDGTTRPGSSQGRHGRTEARSVVSAARRFRGFCFGGMRWLWEAPRLCTDQGVWRRTKATGPRPARPGRRGERTRIKKGNIGIFLAESPPSPRLCFSTKIMSSFIHRLYFGGALTRRERGRQMQT